MGPVSVDDAILAIPEGWRLTLTQCDNDWSASLVHNGLAWQVGVRGDTAVDAIMAVTARINDACLMPEGLIARARR